LKRQEEIRLAREREKERKRELRELTASARWDGEGPRPPGTDINNYRHDKDMGYVAKNKCWVWTPGETNLWYQKRSGRYYVYDRASHSYVYSHGGIDPVLEAQMEAENPVVEEPVKVQAGEGAWSSKTEAAPEVEEMKEPVKQKKYHFGTESWAGRKETLEDRYCEDEYIDGLGVMFGMFDGHGGFACAEHASKRIPKHLSSVWPKHKSSGRESEAVAEAFSEAFANTDSEYLKISKKKNAEDGSTAVCALIVGDLSKDPDEPPRLYTANLGDSRAILCRAGEAIPLTKDHKPNDRDEKKRIEGCGGKVVQIGSVWRVTKRDVTNRPTVKVFLSTSRSLGDRPLKIPDPLVSGQPEIKMLRISPNDYCIVLVCDGVTDVMTDQEIVDVACDYLEDPQVAAKQVVKAAYNKKSKDNLTAMVIRLTKLCDGADKTIKKYRAARRAKEEVSRICHARQGFSCTNYIFSSGEWVGREMCRAHTEPVITMSRTCRISMRACQNRRRPEKKRRPRRRLPKRRKTSICSRKWWIFRFLCLLQILVPHRAHHIGITHARMPRLAIKLPLMDGRLKTR